MWDAFVDVWSVCAGAIAAPAEPPAELRRAASILLALDELGLLERKPGWTGRGALRALGGTLREGLEAMPGVRNVKDGNGTWHLDRSEYDQLLRTAFGTRKRVIEMLALPSDALPRSRTTPPGALDSPQACTARRLVAWARRHGIEAQVLEGPFLGEDLTEWDPTGLAAADEELAESEMLFRLYLGPGRSFRVRVAPGRENLETAGASCQTPRSQCEAWCPLFGHRLCAKYEIGIGWSDGIVSSYDGGLTLMASKKVEDHRRIHQMPASKQSRVGLPYMGG